VVAHEVPEQVGNDHPLYMPTGAFKTKDGHINIAGSGNLFPRLCKVIGMEELLTHPDYCDYKQRHKNRIALVKVIEEKTRQRSSAEWVEALNKAGVPCGPIYRMNEVFADPQIKHLGMAVPTHHYALGDIEVVNQGVRLSRTPFEVRAAAPDQGVHTEEVLKEYGYSAADISKLREAKAI
jgi:crotonobetainyl-CoA:carnitine CoA-transferase CaiB-like acyl-CoA transferase